MDVDRIRIPPDFIIENSPPSKVVDRQLIVAGDAARFSDTHHRCCHDEFHFFKALEIGFVVPFILEQRLASPDKSRRK